MVWEFVHKCTKFGCTRHSRNKFRSALVGTNSLTATLQNSRCRESVTFPIRKFFCSDVESIECVGAVCAVFEQCSFYASCESGKPMTSDSASFSPPLSLRSSPLELCLQRTDSAAAHPFAENTNLAGLAPGDSRRSLSRIFTSTPLTGLPIGNVPSP